MIQSMTIQQGKGQAALCSASWKACYPDQTPRAQTYVLMCCTWLPCLLRGSAPPRDKPSSSSVSKHTSYLRCTFPGSRTRWIRYTTIGETYGKHLDASALRARITHFFLFVSHLSRVGWCADVGCSSIAISKPLQGFLPCIARVQGVP
jgi:hypothetical protein